MVEKKCIEIDAAQSSYSNKSWDEEWEVLIAFHRTLLKEHHNFFLASHHPAASPALRRLADKYAMPARMWEHGLEGFLKLLRNQMPGTSKHMLEYLDLAYSVLESLEKYVSSLASEWTECIKGLDMYRDELQKIAREDQELGIKPNPRFRNVPDNALPLPGICKLAYLGFTHPLQDMPEADLYARADHSHATPCQFDRRDGQYGSSFTSTCTQCQYQASSSSGFVVPSARTSILNLELGRFDGCDEPYLPSEGETASSSASRGSSRGRNHPANDDQGFDTQNRHKLLNGNRHQPPLGTTLSRIGILVLAGWLLVGQGSSLDFNIFVKAFCILALPSLK